MINSFGQVPSYGECNGLQPPTEEGMQARTGCRPDTRDKCRKLGGRLGPLDNLGSSEARGVKMSTPDGSWVAGDQIDMLPWMVRGKVDGTGDREATWSG